MTESTHEDVLATVTEASEKQERFAGFWMRLWAYLLDLIVIASLNRIFIHPVADYFNLSDAGSSMFSTTTILTTAMMYCYFVFMTKVFQQTIGKIVFGLKVLPINGTRPSWLTVIFREVIGKFIGKTCLFIGFLMVAFTNKKQGLHDKIADTVVIHE